jgi:23S rRNA (guanosine2251-2'-O)-methyltransferase
MNNKICLIAVDIRSAHNIGSLFRTADGFSADVVLTGICPRPEGDENDDRLPHIVKKAHEAINKTALGAETTVDWRYYITFLDAYHNMKKKGYVFIAIEQHKKSKPLNNLKITKPTALILGTEVKGLSAEIIDMCDEIYEIPMTGKKESFNVAVSAGIALYQARLCR